MKLISSRKTNTAVFVTVEEPGFLGIGTDVNRYWAPLSLYSDYGHTSTLRWMREDGKAPGRRRALALDAIAAEREGVVVHGGEFKRVKP